MTTTVKQDERVTTTVKLDGRTYEFLLPPQLLELDGTDPGAKARRDTGVLREITKYKPEAAEGQVEWGTDPASGKTMITVSRQAKTKGQKAWEEANMLNPVLVHLSQAAQKVPPALTLVIILRTMELNRRLDAPTFLVVQSRIEGAKESARQESEYARKVFGSLKSAHAAPSPWEPLGF